MPSKFQLQMTSTTSPKFQPQLSPMVNNMALSKTIEIHGLTKEMERNKQTVFSLCVGEPDYQPPHEVLAATVCILAIHINAYYCWFLLTNTNHVYDKG